MLVEMISLTSYTGPLHCHACGAEYSTAVRNLTQFKIKNLTGLKSTRLLRFADGLCYAFFSTEVFRSNTNSCIENSQ